MRRYKWPYWAVLLIVILKLVLVLGVASRTLQAWVSRGEMSAGAAIAIGVLTALAAAGLLALVIRLGRHEFRKLLRRR